MNRLRAIKMFLSLLWRRTGYFQPEDDYRFSWKQSWEIASGIYLENR